MKLIITLALFVFTNFAHADNDPKAGLSALKDKLSKYGAVKVDGKASVAGKEVPALVFGKTKISNNYEAVDEVKKRVQGTATVFVKDGDEYVRVSTNVLKDDGSRAVGTPLAHNKAYEAIQKGETFCGEVQILEKPYDTCYEPIVADGKTVGIYYFGYKK